MQAYDIVKELGSGSFGKVYKVVKKADSKVYAMKQIKLKELNSKEKDNALNEVRLLASIDAPNIIKYKQAFFVQQGSLLSIVMEFADGGDLTGLIKKKVKQNTRFKEEFIWKMAFDLISGMAIMHENKIIHRDIKSANVFIANGVAKLGDLNVSKVLEGKFATTQTGTPYYTAPQIWNGVKYDTKCDVWSFGCLIYQLCAFKPPFMAKDFPGLGKKVNAGYFEPIPSCYSKKLSSLIRKCLMVDTAKRPSADLLLNDDIFLQMRNMQGGQIDLLDTIRCPKVLSMLNKQLPKRQSKREKVVTMKLIELDGNDSSNFQDWKKKQLRKLTSQKCIQLQQDTKDRMMAPMQSPKGVVKLPKIYSQKKIL